MKRQHLNGNRAAVPCVAGGAGFEHQASRSAHSGRETGAGPADGQEASAPNAAPEAVAQQAARLVTMIVPAVVAATIRELMRSGSLAGVQPAAVLEAPPPAAGRTRPPLASESALGNCRQLAIALGVSAWIAYAVKKANRVFYNQGKEGLIFTGRYSTVTAMREWLKAHPDFVAGAVLAPKRRVARNLRKGDRR